MQMHDKAKSILFPALWYHKNGYEPDLMCKVQWMYIPFFIMLATITETIIWHLKYAFSHFKLIRLEIRNSQCTYEFNSNFSHEFHKLTIIIIGFDDSYAIPLNHCGTWKTCHFSGYSTKETVKAILLSWQQFLKFD